jgi:hypothetical protein
MKAKIKAAYLRKLVETYPDIYTPESRALNLAGLAADNALAGRLKLVGECWYSALEEATGSKRVWRMADLAALPNDEQGPVLIVDGRGGHPGNLDRAIAEQAAYYRKEPKP